MGYEVPLQSIGTKVTAADLSAKQSYAVKLNSSGNVAIADTAGEKVLGILQNKPDSGRVADVAIAGVVKAILGGTVDEGDSLTVDANGKLVVGYGADRKVAISIDAGVSGDVVQVLLMQEQGFCQHGPHSKSLHYNLADIADGDIASVFVPGYAGRIKKFYAVTTKVATTGGKLTTLNLEIGTTNLTGGALALTSANQTPIGALVNASDITAANTFSATDGISIEASSTTAFGEGEVELVIEFA